MGDNNNNFFFAVLLCLAVLLGWQYFVIDPQIAAQKAAQEVREESAPEIMQPDNHTDLPAPLSDAPLPAAPTPAITQNPAAPDNAPRLSIQTPQLEGSLSLRGAKLDTLTLTQFPVSLHADQAVQLLQPESAQGNYWQVTYGWIGQGALSDALPDANTLWQIESGATLTPDSPVTLKYTAPNGLTFRRNFAVDENFMFTITQSVENNSTQSVNLYPYGQISRRGRGTEPEIFVLHEGGIGVLGAEQELYEVSYSDLTEEDAVQEKTAQGWVGLTDKYWATALIPPQGETFNARLRGSEKPTGAEYRADYVLNNGRVVAPNQTISVQSRLFAGAKLVEVVDDYNAQGIEKFDLLIDWGWFYFLTKPMFNLLAFFYSLTGNYGIGILLVTVLIKLIFFPLANKSYITMAKMKRLQPEMMRIRELYAKDKPRQQQEMVKLYRTEKLNPMTGCLPMLIQIPVFFSLYKVLYVTIDVRHQPFFGWIEDLSAPDPTSIFNLFGLLPFSPPLFLMIGIWPVIMGLTMFVQMQMNPPAPDPIQRKIFSFMPLIFTFLLAGFPAGLVIYWAWNNFLSVMQQGFIMKRHGAEIELLANLGLKKRSKSDKG